jgi:hypothetical protein
VLVFSLAALNREKEFIGIGTYLFYNNQLYFQSEKEGDEKPNTEG